MIHANHKYSDYSQKHGVVPAFFNTYSRCCDVPLPTSRRNKTVFVFRRLFLKALRVWSLTVRISGGIQRESCRFLS